MIARCIKTSGNRIWNYVLVILMSTPFIGLAPQAHGHRQRMEEWPADSQFNGLRPEGYS